MIIFYTKILALVCLLAGVASASPSNAELREKCQERTGLSGGDIRDFHKRNEGCLIDCITRQGTIMSLFTKKGTKCGDQENYSCFFGKCLPKGDQSVTGDLYSIDMSIISAHVPDLDTLPMGGPSDAFVIIEADKYSDPSYDDGELMCHTYVVQDNSNPRWNFRCKPLPMRLTSRIKFNLFDSDKPSDNHDRIGHAIRSVEDLINKGPQRLQLNYNGSEDNHNYHVVVEVKGQEYESSTD